MAAFPMFVDLKGKTCIVVGGGEVAYRKIKVLLEFEARVVVIAPEVSGSIEELGNQAKISIIKKEYSEQDATRAFLVIAATSSPQVDESVFRNAVKRNIPVNTVDDIEKCTFIFPSVVKRGELSIGISTSGNYPALSKKLRQITEEIFSEEYTKILNLLTEFRLKVRNSYLSQKSREKLLKQVLDEFYQMGKITHQDLKIILGKYETELEEKGSKDKWMDRSG